MDDINGHFYGRNRRQSLTFDPVHCCCLGQTVADTFTHFLHIELEKNVHLSAFETLFLEAQSSQLHFAVLNL